MPSIQLPFGPVQRARRSLQGNRWLLACLAAAGCLIATVGCSKTDSPGVTASVSGASAVGGTSRASATPDATPAQDTMHPLVRIETTLGSVTVELDGERAPITVKNFLWYANHGHYEKTIFHQVVPGYVAIAGGYGLDQVEKPTHIEIRNEADNGLKNRRGTISMARRPDVVNSSTSQFFFNLSDNANLDQRSRNKPEEFGYCVFGRVTEGQDVLDRISKAPVTNSPKLQSTPATPIVIKSVTRVR
ncbi:MAG: peptidylprolyl isomerase [Planctomycetia bacterium]|nr:peptidylprolyl isomerase [Planctomycetia bacterium]